MPQHALLLAWPVTAAVSVSAGTQMYNFLPAECSRHSRRPNLSVQLLFHCAQEMLYA